MANIEVHERYATAVVGIKGRFLGSLHGASLRDVVAELKTAGKTNVVIDLSATDFMDSSGLGELLTALTTMRRAGGDVRLAGIETRIKNLFLVTKVLGPVFTDYASVEEAAQSFRTHPPAARNEA